MAEPVRLHPVQTLFGIQAASRMMLDAMPPWIQDLGILVESVESGRPAGAAPDWQPGAVLRLPFSRRLCREGGIVCAQALSALADAAMLLACSAAWNGYRPMSPIDHTVHYMRPVNFDVLADARIVRIGRSTSFGRVNVVSAADRRPVAMMSSAYAML